MPYDGGKSQAGTWQRIVTLIPEHRQFVELFAGSAAIARLKRPAEKTVLVEKSAKQAEILRVEFSGRATVVHGDGITLAQYLDDPETVAYADPPYVLSTRGGGKYYEHELVDAEHLALLRALWVSRCKVILSGYQSALYDAAGFSLKPAAPWTCDTFKVFTRGHTWATECLWFNFPRPISPHDASNAGDNFRERWRIEKRRRRLKKKFEAMPPLERASIFAVLAETMSAAADAEPGAGRRRENSSSSAASGAASSGP